MTMGAATGAASASGGAVSIEALEADYAARNPLSLRQYELGRTVMPGGVAKGAYFSKPYPLFLVSGEGCYVTTLDGQRLLDCANHHHGGDPRTPASGGAGGGAGATGAGVCIGRTHDGGV